MRVVSYKFYLIVVFCVFVSSVWAVSLPNGVDVSCEDVVRYEDGAIKRVKTLEPCEIETPLGHFTFLGGLYFSTDGKLLAGQLEKPTQIKYSLGFVMARILSFSEKGAVSFLCEEGTKVMTPIGEVEILYDHSVDIKDDEEVFDFCVKATEKDDGIMNFISFNNITSMSEEEKEELSRNADMITAYMNGIVIIDKDGIPTGFCYIDANSVNIPFESRMAFMVMGGGRLGMLFLSSAEGQACIVPPFNKIVKALNGPMMKNLFK